MFDNDDFNRQLAQAELFQRQCRNLADTLEGAVTELKIHGWTDAQAREIICAMFRPQPDESKQDDK